MADISLERHTIDSPAGCNDCERGGGGLLFNHHPAELQRMDLWRNHDTDT